MTAKRITHCGSYVKLECEMVNFARCDEEIIITMRLLHRHSDIERSKKKHAHAPNDRSNSERIHEIDHQVIIKNVEVQGRVKRIQ